MLFTKSVTSFHTGPTISTIPKSIVFSSLTFLGTALSSKVPPAIFTFIGPATLSNPSSLNTYLIPFVIDSFSVTNDFVILFVSTSSSKTCIWLNSNLLVSVFKYSSVPSNVISIVEVVTGVVSLLVQIGAIKSTKSIVNVNPSQLFVGFEVSFNVPAGKLTVTGPL